MTGMRNSKVLFWGDLKLLCTAWHFTFSGCFLGHPSLYNGSDILATGGAGVSFQTCPGFEPLRSTQVPLMGL